MKNGLISRDTDYAVRALCAMARRPGKSFTVSDLARLTMVPSPFLRGILQKLAREKIVSSSRGRGGGFRLARDPSGIGVLEVMAVFQGETRFANCLLRERECPNMGACRLRRQLRNLEKMFLAGMEEMTIAALIEPDGNRQPSRPAQAPR